MPKAREFRRENFDVSPEQQAEIEALQELLEAPSKKEALLMAVELTLQLVSETKSGFQVFIGTADKADLRRFFMLGIEKPNIQKWMYLVEHAHPWKKQLYVKGRKLPAAAVWSGMTANKQTPEQAAKNWDLPIEAVREIIAYCQSNQALLRMEADEELRRLEEKGIELVPKASRR
jgi:hypothetical protein